MAAWAFYIGVAIVWLMVVDNGQQMISGFIADKLGHRKAHRDQGCAND